MIVDSSALLAIVKNEPERADFLAALSHGQVSMSVVNHVETAVVTDRQADPVLGRRFDALVDALRIDVAPVTVEQGVLARAAYRDFGRGSGHPARLNFGDCFAYALAIATDRPLLFKGDDFGHTEVRRA